MSRAAAPAKRPRTASRAVRRRQLIEATIECIAQRGLTGTTMAEVTRLAGLSMGIVSFHFQSKENLLKETLVFLAEEHRACWSRSLANSALAPAAKLVAVIDAHFHPSTCNHTRIAVWFAFFGEARYRAIYREHISQFDTERKAAVAALCRGIVQAGGYSGVNPLAFAATVESLSDGLWLSIMLYPDGLTPATAKQRVMAYMASVFPHHFEMPPEESPRSAGECRVPGAIQFEPSEAM